MGFDSYCWFFKPDASCWKCLWELAEGNLSLPWKNSHSHGFVPQLSMELGTELLTLPPLWCPPFNTDLSTILNLRNITTQVVLSGKGKTFVLKGWKGKGRKRTGAMFTRRELSKFNILARGHNFVEVMCGVTSRKYGDYGGRIKIFRDGSLRIKCECYKGCTADNMTLAEFKDHTSPPPGESRWKPGHIWTFTKGGKKPSLHKTCLLKYYAGSAKDSWNMLRPRRGRIVHRNEFVKCAKCGKLRRFLLNTKEDCRAYHRASLSENWTCADFPSKKISCKDEEERKAKNLLKGCPRRPLCRGCYYCVCFGCKMCRFKDCSCRTCLDFIANAGDDISDDEKNQILEEDEQILEEDDQNSEEDDQISEEDDQISEEEDQTSEEESY